MNDSEQLPLPLPLLHPLLPVLNPQSSPAPEPWERIPNAIHTMLVVLSPAKTMTVSGRSPTPACPAARS
jgi:hypothetical protein